MAAGIEWMTGALDDALALAAAQQRPLFLYWGARWCPPCNRVKADIFSSDEVQRRLAPLLAFQLDGDSVGAQALAARFRLRSYPTLVLFAPDGSEITRLPCELDADGFAAVLDVALAVWRAASSAAAALNASLSGTRALSADEWTLLSRYSWDTDEGVLLSGRKEAEVLRTLSAKADAAKLTAGAGAAPASAGAPAAPSSPSAVPDAAARLALFAQLAGAPADTNALLDLFGDARLARANMDILVNSAVNLIKTASRREELIAALSVQAAAWAEDFWLSAIDRLLALRLQMRLARLVSPAEALQAHVSARVAAALAESSNEYERHSLVNTAVSLLNDAGLPQMAEQVLQDELPRSHSPYYFMLSLASAAKRRGDIAGVLHWYEQAATKAVGPATRMQWGTTYLVTVIELAPQDTARIEQAAERLLHDVAAASDYKYQRNLAQLERLAPQFGSLSTLGEHTLALLNTLSA
jgi:hypothetical protein